MSNLWEPGELSRFRVSYDRGQLSEADLQPTPLRQFQVWMEELVASGWPEPNAMVLSTVDASGQPTARTVLLKDVDAAGFRFFTNYRSLKARAIEENPQVALLFPWHGVHRQVTVLGRAERMSASESEAYFRSRPPDSQRAAWASFQSEPINNRSVLEHRMEELKSRWPEGEAIPYPTFWGGYLVRADSIEFWHGRVSRLHDRLRYESVRPNAPLDAPSAWTIRRYSP